MLTHIDLFSGVGGFALAAQWAGFRTIAFVEIESYPQSLIKKHFPGVFLFEDIKNFNWKGECPTLITGGFPCQPFSSAGRKRGTADDRYLWPPMLRIISQIRPTWVLAENVINIGNMVLADCENDLEAEGYEAQSLDIPACACGLSTMERHIWIIASLRSEFLEGYGKECLSRVRKIHSCKRRTNHNETQGFPPIPDLSLPKLCRSRKGIPNWVERHRAIGNAIPPQVAYEIIKEIARIEEATA